MALHRGGTEPSLRFLYVSGKSTHTSRIAQANLRLCLGVAICSCTQEVPHGSICVDRAQCQCSVELYLCAVVAHCVTKDVQEQEAAWTPAKGGPGPRHSFSARDGRRRDLAFASRRWLDRPTNPAPSFSGPEGTPRVSLVELHLAALYIQLYSCTVGARQWHVAL